MIQDKFINQKGKTFISMYGKETSFEDFDFREERSTRYEGGYVVCYNKEGEGTVIDALGRTYPEKEKAKYKEGLDELSHLHACIFAGQTNIEKLIKNIDYNLFLDDDFHKAVIKLYAHYQKLEVESCKEAGKKINIKKIESRMNQIVEVCDKKGEKVFEADKNYKDAMDTIENCDPYL